MSSSTSHENQTSVISNCILFMIFLLVLNELIQTFYNKYKSRYAFTRYIHSTTITTFIGVFAGLTLNILGYKNGLSTIKAGFSELFLIVLLPPILFESALNMEKYYFFRNFGTILSYAVVGTLIASFLTALLIWVLGVIHLTNPLGLRACVAFGALISATDPVAVLAIFKEYNVNKNLYILIFGESILNDAIAIILFETTVKISRDSYMDEILQGSIHFLLVLILSILIGFVIGVVCAVFLKKNISQSGSPLRKRKEKPLDINNDSNSSEKNIQNTNNNNNNNDSENKHKELEYTQFEKISNRETTIMILVPWLSYLIAEGLQLSGIVSIMFCGITMARYALPNLTSSSLQLVKRLYHTAAYTFENLVFLFIGIGFFGFELAYKDMGILLFFFSFIVINFARLVNIYLVTKAINSTRDSSKITKNTQIVMWYSGFRGAMAYALAIQCSKIFIKNNEGNIILTITLLFITINIFINGGFLLKVIEKFQDGENWEKMKDISINQIEIEERPKNFWNQLRGHVAQFDKYVLREHLIQKEINLVGNEEKINSKEEEDNFHKEKDEKEINIEDKV